ncbi:MAG: hypothetical protein JW704_05875 [Anaerolineaceae bacterium]|nr:hypothetical protein [Anaerolineaceae bacterium]MBN2676501.1 hypothetical protein [Anaerolineaceae bacterium]
MASRSAQTSQHSTLISGLEKRLSSTIKPVKPDGDFVQRLKERLASTPSLNVEQEVTPGLLLAILGLLLMILGFFLGKHLWKYLFPASQDD